MDYEHQPINHLAFRLANRVIVPEPFPESSLRRYGARGDRVIRYAGIKEQIYLSDFVPDPAYREKIGLPQDQIVVVLRPPATWASYHPKKNELMAELIDYLSASDQTRVVFLPRIAIQKSEIAKWNIRNFWIPDHVLDGPNLLHSADLVISAGGTMNRESAVLGTPTYTIFAGPLGAVDQYLINGGRMKVIARAQDFPPLKRCESARNRLTGKAIIDEITNAMLDVAKR
jgi:predicted glycosyltransferase